MSSKSIYYVYIYRHPESKIPFYVGYGKGDRMLSHLREATREPNPKQGQRKLNTIRKIIKEGSSPIIEIADSELTKEEACELECFLISEIGRLDLGTGPLTNLTMGGDGNRGWSPEARKFLSEKQSGMISVKDSSGSCFRVTSDDPRWISGELVGIAAGKSSNINGKLDDYIQAKDSKGNAFRVKPNDPRWLSGELVGINKNRPAHQNTVAAAKARKGIPKTKEHSAKVGASMKLLKWFCNFELNKVGRFKEGEQPDGFVRVSGPHKRDLV